MTIRRLGSNLAWVAVQHVRCEVRSSQHPHPDSRIPDSKIYLLNVLRGQFLLLLMRR